MIGPLYVMCGFAAQHLYGEDGALCFESVSFTACSSHLT